MPATLATDWITATGTAVGTCGELAQGRLPGGERFHVTCPINRGAQVTVRVRPAAGPDTVVQGLTPEQWKTERALHAAARLLELPPVEITARRLTSLEIAKGMASSTADIVAAARALAIATGQTLDGALLARLATSIEPSDGVMYSGIRAVELDRGSVLRTWTWWPRYAIAMFTPPDVRETSSVDWAGQAAFSGDYADLLAQLDAAVEARDAVAFARQSTRSAWLNEAFVPNPLLRTLAPLADDAGADGVCVGHSGTVCGLLFSGVHRERLASEAADLLPPSLPIGTAAAVVRTPLR
jgi:L-threonine kinase